MEFPTNEDKWNYVVENKMMTRYSRYNDHVGYCISNDGINFFPVKKSKDSVAIFLFHVDMRTIVSFTDFKDLEEFLETETNLIILDGL